MSLEQLSPAARHCLEQLCERGCREVSALLLRAETGTQLKELEGFDSEEKNAILTELRAIMAVYGGYCKG